MVAQRKRRRAYVQEEKMPSNKKSKKQLITMIISFVIMVFTVLQVYYLARYTLGYSVSSNQLKVYRWVKLLAGGDSTQTK